MGYYINPKDKTKEQWLKEHGERVSGPDTVNIGKETMAVCLVDNGWMTAAGICYDVREAAAFNDPRDTRPKIWYSVPVSRLLEVEPTLSREL